MKFAGNLIFNSEVHTIKEWKSHFAKLIDDIHLSSKLVKEVFLSSSVKWAQIELITKDWNESAGVQSETIIDANKDYFYTYLIQDEKGNKIVVTFNGTIGFGECFDIFITYMGELEYLNEHLKHLNISKSTMTVTQQIT